MPFPRCAESLLQVPGAIGRLFAAYSCGSDPVVCETARLLLRLWAPAAARAGAGRLEATSACRLLTLVVLSERDRHPAVGGAVLCLTANACSVCLCRAAPWKLSPSHNQDTAGPAPQSHYEPTHEDLVLSKSAKSLCFPFFGEHCLVNTCKHTRFILKAMHVPRWQTCDDACS